MNFLRGVSYDDSSTLDELLFLEFEYSEPVGLHPPDVEGEELLFLEFEPS